MPVIDADAHVIETMATWAYLEESEKRFSPIVVEQTQGPPSYGLAGNPQKEYWVIDGRLHGKQLNIGLDTAEGARELRDVDARLAHMDALGIDVQVLYPTLFLRPVTSAKPVEYALVRSYNRWLGEIWKQGKGRLRWVAVPPLLSMDRVHDELRWAKDHGACGIFVRGLEGDRPISDPMFFPLFEIAGELDLAICLHSGQNSFHHVEVYKEDRGFLKFQYPGVAACYLLLSKEIPKLFPKVRWGFVELSASWVPFVLNGLDLLYASDGRHRSPSILADNNMYVGCQVTDDIPYILGQAGPDCLIIGTDYGHHDTASEIEALRKLRDDGSVERSAVGRILEDNPRALYRL